MTRILEEIDAELENARAIYQAQCDLLTQNRSQAEDLRRRVIAGDTRVTAAQLAKPADEAALIELGMGAKLAAVQALEKERAVALVEQFADSVVRTLPTLEEEFQNAFAGVEAALVRLVVTWRAHANFVSETHSAVGHLVSGDVSPRVVRQGGRTLLIDRKPVRPLGVQERLINLIEQTQQLLWTAGARDH